jgi:predicted esterase
MWFDNGLALPEARVVIVVATDQDLTDEWERVPLVADEILSCYGGDPGKVHLAGTSNGGLGAYSAMLDAPERFATLLGCPGVWLQWDEDRIVAALQGKSVFNGVGELDTSWQPYVQRTHEALLDLGIDSVYVEFEGQGHIPGPDFDGSEMYHFWAEHSE